MRTILRPRLAVLCFVALAALLVLPSGALAEVARASFQGGYTAANPCNGENLAGPVTIDMLYQTVDGHYNIHVKVAGDFTGDQGNSYSATFIANAVLNAPSYVAGGALHFLVPMHAVFISQDAAPNFTQAIVLDVGIVNGQPDSVWTTQVTSSCGGGE